MANNNSAYKKLKVIYEDIERMVVKGENIEPETINAVTQKKIINQVNEEYDLAYRFNEAKRAVWLERLKLYNNQRRDADVVGDPLLFTVFNTVHAALYDDRLMASWEGRGGEGDADVEENLNALSEYDYDIMGKDEIDYDWNWDAEFFGRGLLQLMDFDRTDGIMSPIPEVIDPTAFIRDPRAKSVNGNTLGKGAMRFGGYETGATYYELKGLPGYFNIGSLKKDAEIRSLLGQASEARNEAQARDNFPAAEESLGKFNNYEFKLINWFTTIRGKRYLITLGNRRSQLIRLVELKYGSRWPILDRALYPMAHDWDGVSIPDLTEDKQRMRSVLINLGLKSFKADVMPQYLFDRTRIKNTNDLNFRALKFIGVDGRTDNVVTPMQRSTAHQYVDKILEILDTAAQRATSTPEIQQGINPRQERTLGELQLVSSKVDTRYSMSAKVYGWSERAFWRQWYRLYKIHFKDKIDEKIIRVQGALSPVWRPLQKDNIIADVDPDVKIESKVISEAKRIREQQSFGAFAAMALQDPQNDRRYIQKKAGKLVGLKKEEVDMAFPPTVDEIQAEDENVILNSGKMPKISVQDDHRVHISIHAKAVENAQTMAHIRAHKKLMIIKRNRIDLFPPQVASMPMAGQQMTMDKMQTAGVGKAPSPTTATQ